MELEAIGLWQPLRSALDIIDSKAHTFFSSQIISASTSISQKPVTEQNLHEAKSALEKIQEADSNNQVAQTSIAVITMIIEARVAASTTRYNGADDLLNQALNSWHLNIVLGQPSWKLQCLCTGIYLTCRH